MAPIEVKSDDIVGTVTPGGLSDSLRVTTMEVSTTALKLPAVALAKRKAMAVFNPHATTTLYFGDVNVTADTVVGITSGMEIGPGETWNFDITDEVDIYGRIASGTITIKIKEIA